METDVHSCTHSPRLLIVMTVYNLSPNESYQLFSRLCLRYIFFHFVLVNRNSFIRTSPSIESALWHFHNLDGFKLMCNEISPFFGVFFLLFENQTETEREGRKIDNSHLRPLSLVASISRGEEISLKSVDIFIN